MVLTPHAVIGAAVAAQFPDKPVLGVVLAFISHFVLDAIPHWHYPVPAFKKAARERFAAAFFENKRAAARDIMAIGTDFFLGFAIVITATIAVSPPSVMFLSLLGGLAGILPDILQFAYLFVPDSPLKHLQYFHVQIVHAKKRLDEKHLLGISQQLLIIALGIWLISMS